MTETERFWRLVTKSDGCWTWNGHGAEGYGLFKAAGRRDVLAHRFAYELANGPIPVGLTIDHLCRNRGCVRPDHLEAVSMRENILRSPFTLASLNVAKTECPKGHAYDETNTRVYRGQRSCRTCNRERMRALRAASA